MRPAWSLPGCGADQPAGCCCCRRTVDADLQHDLAGSPMARLKLVTPAIGLPP